jgi:predicted transcriptional regulator
MTLSEKVEGILDVPTQCCMGKINSLIDVVEWVLKKER